jgi:RNA-directed DNA polymerase
MVNHVARGLALAFLAGAWTQEGLVARGREALGRAPRWLAPLAREVLARFPEAPLDGDVELAAWIAGDGRLAAAIARAPFLVRRWLVPEPAMRAVSGAPAGFAVAPLASHAELARHLGLSSTMLSWFADRRGMNARTSVEPLLHYRYRWVAKARGGYRLLEEPKPRLKALQRWVLRHVLDAVPTAPPAHGFVAGRSVLTFVAPHVGREVVVRLDLQDFFASVRRARVVALFRRLGYPRDVALTLAAVCTVAAPAHVLADHPRQGADLQQRFLTNSRLRDPHLPQGAPTSPALSNLVAWRLDRRLAALAASHGAVMTRYADDLAFAGDRAFAASLRFFLPRAAAIALEEGFAVNHRKTRVMRRGQRQQLCGVVVNQRASPPRAEIDNLRALLFNAARSGPESQNRSAHPRFRAHLEGRIAWVASINPGRARKLRALFDGIRWE